MLFLIFSALLIAVSAGGCEERVVSARGIGADYYKVQQPLYDPPEWERKIFGDPVTGGK